MTDAKARKLCKACKGIGRVRIRPSDPKDFKKKRCPDCGGTGIEAAAAKAQPAKGA